MIKLYEKGIYLLRGEEIVTEEDRERLAALPQAVSAGKPKRAPWPTPS